LLISCGGLRTFEIIEVLERDLGLPIVTSNQAGLWGALRLARVRENIQGFGRLLATMANGPLRAENEDP
jgi:maleate isomerase